MSTARGSQNNQPELPEIVGLGDGEKLEILADILLDMIFEEGENAATK
ncbi:MAG: hypothetical protein PVI21_00885 [Candidatus Woesebacteria bacterium]|jgi:hypothetical protein